MTITEDGVAAQFARDHEGRWAYCVNHKAWFMFDGAIWRRQAKPLAFHLTRETAFQMSEAACDQTPKTRSAAFCRGVETFTRADPVFSREASDWDRDAWLLGCPGGTIDLRTGKLRKSEPADMITKSVAVTPGNTADCPRWLTFISEANASDADTIRLLRRWAGYSLTGETREHALAFILGDGGTGKSVFVNTMAAVLGDYAVTAPMEVFTVGQFDRHPTELAMLRGARLVTASETEAGRVWAEARIKQITGGDPIAARFMRGDFFNYIPQFKLMITGNHAPALQNLDNGIRRRFRIVPFSVRPWNPNPRLYDELRTEWPGILRWMIDGCLDWRANGLPTSKSVSDATEYYFSDQDAVGRWLKDECDIEPTMFRDGSRSSELFESWRDYARKVGEDPRTNKWLSSNLERRGYTKKDTRLGMVWPAISLQTKRR